MTDHDFFCNSARECREMAARAGSDYVKGQLLLWARQFDALAGAHDTARTGVSEYRLRQMAAAD